MVLVGPIAHAVSPLPDLLAVLEAVRRPQGPHPNNGRVRERLRRSHHKEEVLGQRPRRRRPDVVGHVSQATPVQRRRLRKGIQTEGAPGEALRDSTRHRGQVRVTEADNEDADGVLSLHDATDEDIEETVPAHHEAEACGEGPFLCDQHTSREAGVRNPGVLDKNYVHLNWVF